MMTRYSLSKLTDRPKGTRVKLPAIAPRMIMEKKLLKLLRSILTQFAKETREGVIPLYLEQKRQRRLERAYTGDVEASWFMRMSRLSLELEVVASTTVRNILNLESQVHSDRFMANAKKALGIDLAAVVRQEDLQSYLDLAVNRNVSLIKSLTGDITKRIEQAVMKSSLNGSSAAQLRSDLQDQFGIVGRRAELIARDQTAKFSSDLDRIRQEQAGVTTYEWSTSHDERVRPRHAALDGKVFKWGDETGAEDGLPPGQPVNCRCVALAIVEF